MKDVKCSDIIKPSLQEENGQEKVDNQKDKCLDEIYKEKPLFSDSLMMNVEDVASFSFGFRYMVTVIGPSIPMLLLLFLSLVSGSSHPDPIGVSGIFLIVPIVYYLVQHWVLLINPCTNTSLAILALFSPIVTGAITLTIMTLVSM